MFILGLNFYSGNENNKTSLKYKKQFYFFLIHKY